MAIHKPPTQLDGDAQRLIELVDELLSHSNEVGPQGNRSADTIVLTDKEAWELRVCLDRLLESRDFLETLYFVDQLYGPSEPDLDELKKVFVSATKRKGRAINIHSTMKWHQFLVRLGVERSRWPYQNLHPMTFDYFLNMERVLFEHLKLNSKTRQALLQIVTQARPNHDNVRQFDFGSIHGERLDRPYEPKQSLFQRIKERARDTFSDAIRREVSAQQLGGLAIIVSNSAVMFTTRDWGVAGTISTMSGAVPLTLIR